MTELLRRPVGQTVVSVQHAGASAPPESRSGRMDVITGQASEPGYFRRIWQLRHFWLSLVRLDLQARYRRSVLGIGWSLVRPLAMCLVLCVGFSKLFRIDDIAGYAPFLLLGLPTFQFLTDAPLLCCTSFTRP